MTPSSISLPVRVRDLLPPSKSVWTLGLLHLVGLLGFLAQPSLFRGLVPLHLVACAALWAANKKQWDTVWATWCLSAGALGYLAEVLGVKTGLLFGQYAYGQTLGVALFDVPLVMALNWALLLALVAEIGVLVGEAGKLGAAARAGLGAALLVLLDLVMEPFATSQGLWTWEDTSVPLQNYVGWGVVSFVLLLPYHLLERRDVNPASVWLYLLQFAFFAGLLPWTGG